MNTTERSLSHLEPSGHPFRNTSGFGAAPQGFAEATTKRAVASEGRTYTCLSTQGVVQHVGAPGRSP